MDEAFARVAPVIRTVAQAEALALEEFCNEDPIWRLAFAREAGGYARIDTTWSAERPGTYQVKAAWIVDDYDSTMRHFHDEVVGEYTAEQTLDELDALLHRALDRIQGWTREQLTGVSGPHASWREARTREEFYRTKLPVKP